MQGPFLVGRFQGLPKTLLCIGLQGKVEIDGVAVQSHTSLPAAGVGPISLATRSKSSLSCFTQTTATTRPPPPPHPHPTPGDTKGSGSTKTLQSNYTAGLARQVEETKEDGGPFCCFANPNTKKYALLSS